MINLPIPSDIEQAHSEKVIAYIQQKISAADGTISFADYMQYALYAPGLGYYANTINFNRDFTTAPELSSSFSFCVAKQTQQVLELLPDNAVILEFGAGSGKMAADILCYLQQQNKLPSEYWILETSPNLQAVQRETLIAQCPDFYDRVKWLAALPQEKFSGVVLANEVLDAMPVHRFVFDGESFQELKVNEQFQYQAKAIDNKNLHMALAKLPIENFSENYQAEVNLWLTPWLASISDLLSQGLILLIDYGYPRAEYYHPQRNRGTIQCYYQHRAHENPFFYPGLQDITAHIDFTAVAEAADAAHLNVAGFTHQAAFLLSCGIQDLAKNSAEIQPLIMPAAMGEVFKVMALTRNLDVELLGFQFLDQRGRLG